MGYEDGRQDGSAGVAIAVAIVFLVGCLVVAGAAFFLFFRVNVQREQAMVAMDAQVNAEMEMRRADAERTAAEMQLGETGEQIADGPGEEAADWQSLFDGKTLDGWKITNFGGEGEVTVEDGAIVMGMGSDMTGVTYTGDPPKSNYELELEGLRRDGIDFFCTTTFPVGDEFCTLVVGGWAGMVVGLSNVDELDASDNVTTRDDIILKDKQWYRVRVRVTDAKIECWIDDKQVVDLAREDHQFSIRPDVDLTKPLGISTWQTVGVVRNLRIRQLPVDDVEADSGGSEGGAEKGSVGEKVTDESSGGVTP